MTESSLLVNLSFLLAQPTGLSIYAANVFPQLKPLQPTLLTAQPIADFACHPVPANLTPAQGSRGHFDRLRWTQLALPQIYRQLAAPLLFSPIPEAPLWSGCRSVVMVHDLIPLRYPQWRSPLMAYFRAYIPQVLRQSVQIICNSQATADDLITFFGVPAAKITPILLGYDRDHFRPSPSPLPPPIRPYFLYVGRHDPHKNVARLIQGFAQLRDRQELDLILVGPTDRRYTPQLLALAAALGVENSVKCLDYVSYDQLRQYYQQAIALVFPSLWEGFGFPVLEAMACGTAVITSNCSSLPEVAGDATLLVDPTDIQALARAMAQLWQDAALRETLQHRGLARSQQFSWQKTGQMTCDLLANFL